MLEVKGLTKKFGKVIAVDSIDIGIDKGETVVMMGPSGCGKSTTIRMINRLIQPDAGFIKFGGININDLKADELRAVRKRIGYVFQHFNLIGRLTALENVMLGLVIAGIPYEIAREKAMDALRKVALEQYKSQRPSELSGGQQQRVGIARALSCEPELMLWDEPTASLDPILVREVLVVMEELAKNRVSAMLVVTHELPFAMHVADKVMLMENGKIVEQGGANQIFGAPQSSVGKRYKELIEYQMMRSVLITNRKLSA